MIFCLFNSSQLSAYVTGRNLINGYFDIELSTQVKEAIDYGTVMNFDCELAVSNDFWLINWLSKQKKHQFTLTYHSLSNRYLVRFNNSQIPINFKSANEATSFITEQSINFFRQYAANNTDSKMRLSLNKFKLLGPIRLNAFISEHWNIDTGWISWSPDI